MCRCVTFFWPDPDKWSLLILPFSRVSQVSLVSNWLLVIIQILRYLCDPESFGDFACAQLRHHRNSGSFNYLQKSLGLLFHHQNRQFILKDSEYLCRTWHTLLVFVMFRSLSLTYRSRFFNHQRWWRPRCFGRWSRGSSVYWSSPRFDNALPLKQCGLEPIWLKHFSNRRS